MWIRGGLSFGDSSGDRLPRCVKDRWRNGGDRGHDDCSAIGVAVQREASSARYAPEQRNRRLLLSCIHSAHVHARASVRKLLSVGPLRVSRGEKASASRDDR